MARVWLYKHHPLPPIRHLAERMFRSLGIALGVIGTALFMGMSGYHHFGEMSWVDSFYNASMILSGRGAGGGSSNCRFESAAPVRGILRPVQRSYLHHDGRCAARAGDPAIPSQVPSRDRVARNGGDDAARRGSAHRGNANHSAGHSFAVLSTAFHSIAPTF